MNNDHNKWHELISARLKQGGTFNSLYEVLVMMKEDGLEQEHIYNLLTDFREQNKNVMTEDQEDILLEMMDVASGFCSSNLKIWDGYIC